MNEKDEAVMLALLSYYLTKTPRKEKKYRGTIKALTTNIRIHDFHELDEWDEVWNKSVLATVTKGVVGKQDFEAIGLTVSALGEFPVISSVYQSLIHVQRTEEIASATLNTSALYEGILEFLFDITFTYLLNNNI